MQPHITMPSTTPRAHHYDWDDPETALWYARFCERHDRYPHASRELAARATLSGGVRVLDVGAGLGHTTEAALALLQEGGSIHAFEPSAAMRALGSARVRDPRVTWIAAEPEHHAPFDRILVGAAIWLMTPLGDTFRRLSSLLAPGGSVSFTIPSLYLLEPDEPGGGDDPGLHQLAARLATPAGPATPEPADAALVLPDAAGLEALMQACGLRPERWSFRHRLTQAEYADWLKLPVLTERLLPDLSAAERAARIDAVSSTLDANSWKWEGWTGWTAWK